MAAKLLHSLADDNPDLQKQIGCMTGIIQLFDRHHTLTSRRLRHKRLPLGNSGDSTFNIGSSDRESFNVYHRHTVVDPNLNKSLNEKKRLSTESSRASFSSSCSSSLSSLECNKTAQPEASSFDRIIFPETPSRGHVTTQPIASAPLGRQSLDLRDVVKDSMYREARGLSVKTTAREEIMGHSVKHKDSPRPLQRPKSVDGSYEVGNMGKQNLPADLKESLRVLAKLREAPCYYSASREYSRSSSWHTTSKDARRFSYDGREITHLPFESRDTIKSTPKLKELRLSLESREISMEGSNSDSKSRYFSKDLQSCGNSSENVYNLQQPLGTQKRHPSVVAKLMGLEALPDSTLTSYSQSGLIKTSPVEHANSFSRTIETNELNRPIRVPKSPRSSLKEPASPRWKNPDLIMKPISKLPIDHALWKQLDGNQGSQKPAFKPAKIPAKTSNALPTVYSEIEKRLKDLEFKQSGKDMRALKQILEAMQAKGLLETTKEEQGSNFGSQREYEAKCTSSNQKLRLPSQRNQQSNHVSDSTTKGSGCLKTFESPIVIMKPAKLVKKSGTPASLVIAIDLPSLHKIQSGGYADGKRGSVNNRTAKDQTPGNSNLDSAVNSSDKKTSARNSKAIHSSTRPQQFPKETNISSLKSTGSVSPRLQQRKLELEKRSRPPTPPSDSSKARRQSHRQPTDLGSSGGKQRLKYAKLPESDDQLSQITNDSRGSSHQGDDISQQSGSTDVFELKTDTEVTRAEHCTEINSGESPLMKAANCLASSSVQKKSSSKFEDDGALAELAVVASEHPSPISVLDASVYRDDALSPVKQIPNVPKGDAVQNSNDGQSEDQWNPADSFLSNSVGSSVTSEINSKKLQNIENLVQKLRRLNSTHNEASTDYIASLCENTNPDHRYISEILLASGLLLRDLGSGLTTFQLHPSGHPINPELFYVLEQTKASSNSVSKEVCSPGKTSHPKASPERCHRKLIFDAVNEILARKLALVGSSPEPWLKSNKLARKTVSAQKLLKEICLEIDYSLEGEEDSLKSILSDDVMRQSESWIDFRNEVSGLVLDVERLVFKDLVDEIVLGEAAAAGFHTKAGRRRQLFAK